jgi:carboxymethylenebutenolidase
MSYETESRTVETPSGMPVFQVFPTSGENFPCFIVLHERFGFVQHTVNVASSIAALGYAVLAPHIYWDYPNQEGLRDSTATTRISDRVALERLDETLKTADGISVSDTSRLGMFGACATGRFPVVWGANRHLDACVVMHGLYRVREWTFDPELYSDEMPEMVRRLQAAFLGQFGELDLHVGVDDVRFIRNQFEEVGQSYQITLYHDAPHGWMDKTKDRYQPDTAERSFMELAEFLEKHLRKPSVRGDEIRWRYSSTQASDYREVAAAHQS